MNETTDKVSVATNTVACNEEATNEVVEEWRPVVGYEGLYEVSNLGRVRKSDTGYMLTARLQTGYKIVILALSAGGAKRTQRKWFVHRLIAQTFIPNPDNKPYVDHIDTNTLNNRVENLRWVTPKENSRNETTLEKFSAMWEGSAEDNPRKRQAIAILKSDTARIRHRAVVGSDAYRANMSKVMHSAEVQEKLKQVYSDPAVISRKSKGQNKYKHPVRCVEITGSFWESVSAAARATGIDRRTISKSCRRAENGTARIKEVDGTPILHFEYIS